jgi:hypothetical protein
MYFLGPYKTGTILFARNGRNTQRELANIRR